MMNRPEITLELLEKNSEILYKLVYSVAKLVDFKAIYESLAFGGEYSLKKALIALYNKDASLKKALLDHVNDDSVYPAIMLELIANKKSFTNIVIPTRKCDFFVERPVDKFIVFFWINERIEIQVLRDTNTIYVAKLMKDELSNSLLCNDGENGWQEYGTAILKENSFDQTVAHRYKEYLAEQELLKD